MTNLFDESNTMDTMTIGERIKAAREMAGVSTKELDRLAGVAAGTIWAAERSRTSNIRAGTALGIARALGVPVEYLLTGDGDPPSEEQVRAAVAAAQAGQTSDSGEHPVADSDSDAEAS